MKRNIVFIRKESRVIPWLFSLSWEQRKVGDILSDVERPIAMLDDETYQLVTVKRRNEGIVSRGYLKGKDILVKNYYRIHEGDFLISKRQVIHGANGYVPKNLDNAVVSNEYMVAVSNNDISTAFWALMSQRKEMYQMYLFSSYGVDVEKMVFNVDDWKKRSVIIPKLEEQTAIVSFFSKLDNLITLHQRKYTKLMNIKKSMLDKMFPKDGASVPEIRFAGFTDAWEQRKLSEACENFEYGLNAAAKEYDGANKYIRITDIDDISRTFSTVDLTSPDICLDGMSKYLLSAGDIVFARTGASVGKTYIYKEKDGTVYFAGFLIRTKVRPEYDSEFIFQNTLTTNYEKYVRITSQRSGQPGVNAQEYGEYMFFAPSKKEQVRIGKFLRELDDLITLHQRELERLQNIKKSCLEKMFV